MLVYNIRTTALAAFLKRFLQCSAPERMAGRMAGLILAGLMLYSTAPFAAAKVLVSVSPLHNLVSALMEGVESPQTLLADNIDLHHFSYKPSDIRKLQSAQLFIWVAKGFEPAMANYIADGLAAEQNLELTARLPASSLVSYSEHGTALIDPHIWLSPALMRQSLRLIADKLAALDPVNAQNYQANYNAVAEKLTALSAYLSTSLQPHQNAPFAVYHPAYAYLIKEAQLQPPLVLQSSAHGQLSLSGLRKLVQAAKRQPQCVLLSYSDPLSKLEGVMQTLEIKSIVVDHLVSGDYFTSMRRLITELKRCFVD